MHVVGDCLNCWLKLHTFVKCKWNFFSVELETSPPYLLGMNIHCEAWPSLKSTCLCFARMSKKNVWNENCGFNDFGLMPFYWISFQWRILRGTTAVQRGPTWCLRASAKSWIRRTRTSRLSRAPPRTVRALVRGDCGLQLTVVLFSGNRLGQEPNATRSLQVTISSVIHCFVTAKCFSPTCLGVLWIRHYGFSWRLVFNLELCRLSHFFEPLTSQHVFSMLYIFIKDAEFEHVFIFNIWALHEGKLNVIY